MKLLASMLVLSQAWPSQALARVAQLVEHVVANDKVVGSSPTTRSIFVLTRFGKTAADFRNHCKKKLSTIHLPLTNDRQTYLTIKKPLF